MTQKTLTEVRTPLPEATLRDTLGLVAGVILPTVAKGVIIRRPKIVALAEWLDLDQRAVRRMQRIRNKYGTGPLLLRIPIRNQVVVLNPDHVHRVLNNSPEPFATASSEKRAALSHFQPEGVLISHGPERADRRRFNEQVLDTGEIMHRLTERFVSVVEEEAELLFGAVRHRGLLTWDDFALTWFRVVRRVVFGDAARDDYELTELIDRLRADANWAFLKPKRTELRNQFYDRLQEHLARADPNSLAGVMAATRTTAVTEPAQQVPQWLFAFDPAGMTTFRALALLASHPEQARQAREEIVSREGSPDLPYLRSCVLESLRLWPTTPAVLRESTVETIWETGVMPARTGILIFAPFFHRDDQRLSYAHTFTPDLWMQERTDEDWPLIPFSGGPAMCPGRNLVLLLSSNMLAALFDNRQVRLKPPNRLDASRPLPGTLDNYSLRFDLGL
jgi:cytochrome P450